MKLEQNDSIEIVRNVSYATARTPISKQYNVTIVSNGSSFTTSVEAKRLFDVFATIKMCPTISNIIAGKNWMGMPTGPENQFLSLNVLPQALDHFVEHAKYLKVDLSPNEDGTEFMCATLVGNNFKQLEYFKQFFPDAEIKATTGGIDCRIWLREKNCFEQFMRGAIAAYKETDAFKNSAKTFVDTMKNYDSTYSEEKLDKATKLPETKTRIGVK